MSPQHIAIPVSNITNGTDGRPVLSFYVQLSADTVVSSSVLMMAVEVSKLINNVTCIMCVNYVHSKLLSYTEMPGFFQVNGLLLIIDIFGSFECSCNEGFVLAANNLDCEGIVKLV